MVPNKYQIIHGWKSNKDAVILPNQKCSIPSALCAVMSMVINLNWFIVIDVKLLIHTFSITLRASLDQICHRSVNIDNCDGMTKRRAPRPSIWNLAGAIRFSNVASNEFDMFPSAHFIKTGRCMLFIHKSIWCRRNNITQNLAQWKKQSGGPQKTHQHPTAATPI